MGQTLAAQAAVRRGLDQPFVFPGARTQWDGVTDRTDAGLLAEQVHRAALAPAAAAAALDTANSDTVRWRWRWPRTAERLGVRPEGYVDQPVVQDVPGPASPSEPDKRQRGLGHDDVVDLLIEAALAW